MADWMLIATPLALPVDFRTRALSGSTVRSVTARVVERLDGITLPPRHVGQAQPLEAAFVVAGHSEISGIGVRVVADAVGTIAARLTERLARGALHTGDMADHRIALLLDPTFGTLTELGASGRGLVRPHLRVT